MKVILHHTASSAAAARQGRSGLRCVLTLLLLLLTFTSATAQITIGGNVYGGGDQGKVEGNTTVKVYGGNFQGGIFGGARMADVGGRAFVNIDGKNASDDYILANFVYGGNDVSGTIGKSDVLPEELTEVKTSVSDVRKNEIDNTWNAFVRISSGNTAGSTDEVGKVYIGQLFGGGNGAYDYDSEKLADGETANPYYGLKKPELGKTYLEIVGGSIVYAFGGGNNATVTEKTVICVDNPSPVVNSIKDSRLDGEQLTDARVRSMGFNQGYSYPNSDAFQIGSFYGGNNLATMDIRPTWNLKQGLIRNIYSGGNRGSMTHLQGLLLEIDPTGTFKADYVYGGCRMADVRPLRSDGKTDATENEIQLEGYNFPAGFSARVLVRGGDINNVYGGNDISGRVYGGSAVGIYSSIHGDVYGGGNGAYPYTDNASLKDDLTYGDFYYDASDAGRDDVKKMKILNDFRPNAEQVAIRLYSPDEENPTVIGGSVYIGGNSATIKTTKSNAVATLRIGSNVFADNVFLGNNGEGMVMYNEEDNDNAVHEGVLRTMKDGIGNDGNKFNSVDLTKDDAFAEYMNGAAMNVTPSVVFDDDYEAHSTYFGSFFCGGNRGSIVSDGTTTINFTYPVVVYNKLVGGCNNAFIEKSGYNAAYNGGILNATASADIRDKIILNLEGLRIEPKRWETDKDGNRGLVWNVFDKSTGKDISPSDISAVSEGTTSTTDDLNRRLRGGNVYGGCYSSGCIDGNVVINLNGTILDRWSIFDKIEETGGEPKLYGESTYNIQERHSGVILAEQGMDVLGEALNVFGGGYGEDAEIWGSTTINLRKGYTFQIFGGGERGAVGKGVKQTDGTYTYTYNPAYSTTINLCGDIPGVARDAAGDSKDMAAAEFIYGGGFEGVIAGNTQINLGNGRIFNSFAGSCNADIYGHTETYVGRNRNSDTETDRGFPWIRDHIYGGNDLGGEIKGTADFASRVSDATKGMVYNAACMEASAYTEYLQGRVDNIFGGCYGDYDYTHASYPKYIAEDGSGVNGFKKPHLGNAFVYFRPVVENTNNQTEKIFGAGQGHTGEPDMNNMQERSYVLVDIPQSMTKYLTTEVFGAGAFGGLGMGVNKETAATNASGIEAAAVIDLVRGQISAAYGANYMEGATRRTIVNVPKGSTIAINNIFGGGYGVDGNAKPCDAYETHVNYGSAAALCNGGIFGGNNSFRRTLYSQVNINAPVMQSNGNQGYVYGAGLGKDTWAQYTELNMNDGSMAYKIYGGGSAGMVLNEASVKKYAADNGYSLDLGGGYTDDYLKSELAQYHELANDIEAGLVLTDATHGVEKKKYNTNVNIREGAHVSGYCYGGGYGEDAIVSGDTYIALLGGTVDKDIYAAGESGAIRNLFEDKDATTFTATANAYIRGGMVRNVYGGGWRGDVGYHLAPDPNVNVYFNADNSKDIDGCSNVIIGNLMTDAAYLNGDPAIMRNAYGAGEGGSIYGSSNVTVYNGHVGYRRVGDDYVEELLDGDESIDPAGNVFGGGYVANSYTDVANVTMYGGQLRGSLYGGGEIGPVGRGALDDKYPAAPINNQGAKIYKAGETHVTLYGGHVMRDVFGGGRGYDNWKGDGTKYYSAVDVEKMDLTAKGFVFGKTDVNILGGEVGTEAGVADGYGNVFGGGNVGFVYSGTGQKSGKKNDGTDNGYYYEYEDGAFITENDEKILTEDCRVVVTPYCKVTDENGITLSLMDKSGTVIDGSTKTFAQGEYVPIDYLNSIKNKSAAEETWKLMDSETGIIIRNAVFAGGNVSTGDDQINANTVTVYGNATATLCDIFHRDLITIGTEHTGGLYGDGNLTFVDGYRELNITNYGTDYYNMSDNISIEEYHALNDRERAYFELKYKCVWEGEPAVVDNSGTEYAKNASITAEDFSIKFKGTKYMLADGTPDPTYWVEAGFCSIYAGRLLNTIQRADFVGVFGSRMVLQGARDRVPEKIDYTDYTINRVGEVSLNQQRSTAGDDPETDEQNYLHGNYFGIYSVVNFMGSLTSDVRFYVDDRTTDNANDEEYGTTAGESFYDWKSKYWDKRKRNNGNSLNKVALASGVFLELTTEESTPTNKIWGPITGVVQLDLINVMPGQGGGYVYAKNIHGKREDTGLTHTIISKYNQDAVTKKAYRYDEADSKQEHIETSGNFVHPTKQIVDDCYPVSNSYIGASAAPAHYWYIKGQVYVYDQIISAYTGASNAYSETVNIPLTITAASHGRMKLLNVKPNLYAYYNLEGEKLAQGDEGKVIINNITYQLNDTITYWDWSQLSAADQSRFVSETYVTITDCQARNADGVLTYYPKGYVMLPAEYEALKAANATTGMVHHVQKDEDVAFTYAFRPSNDLSHDKGFILTYDVSNPDKWSAYYTPQNSDASGKKTTGEFAEVDNKAAYLKAPTYTPKESGVYGQFDHAQSDIITKEVVDTYNAIDRTHLPAADTQAEVDVAYVMTDVVVLRNADGTESTFNVGMPIPKATYDANTSAMSGKADKAWVCTSTIELEKNGQIIENVFYGDLLTKAQIDALQAEYKLSDTELKMHFDEAYYCTKAGKYGGNYFEAEKNYRAVDAWSSLSAEDREHFDFNYDALNLLIDPDYSGNTALYDSEAGNERLLYGLEQPIDYTAIYNGTEGLEYTDENGATMSIAHNEVIGREAFEAIPNEQSHYAPILVDAPGEYYVVKVGFSRGDVPYTVGQTIPVDTYNNLGNDLKQNIDIVSFTSAQLGTYYYCRQNYTVNEHGEGVAVTDALSGDHVATGGNVSLGFVIDETSYSELPNKQKNFSIQGSAPQGTSTLYVSRESDINDLTRGRVITLIYQYDYEESDESGKHIEPISERHVINIYLQFKSGIPSIQPLSAPPLVLPGSTVGITPPRVTPGAAEVIGGGFEMFATEDDALTHTNGISYENNTTKLYYYQDGYYLAYYAKTYLGKTYTDPVQFKVGNYHDMDNIMADHDHHMYVDHPNVKHDCKIYIDNRDCTSDPDKSELDLLKDFYDLTRHNETDENGDLIPISDGSKLDGHLAVDGHIRDAQNLEFFLRSDVSPKAYTAWEPIANDGGECFEGVLHGDGYTISGLTNSLFGHLCGDVYNLGVTGSFLQDGKAQAGIAQQGSGYAENCWIMNSALDASAYTAVGGSPADTYPIIGTPTRTSGIQIVNCYYPSINPYNEATSPRGNAMKKPVHAFYNGEVAYDLNGFYLNKRYNDHINTAEQTSTYRYFDANDPDADGKMQLKDGKYAPTSTYALNYVEDRYADGDFIYAGGSIPDQADARYYVEEKDGVETAHYYPIWPDDYIFFGQQLTYGHVTGRNHQPTPVHINKTSGRLPSSSTGSNRVYRAPAYFRSKQMQLVHFNPDAVLAAKSKDGTQEVFPGMTAIDFTGHGERNYQAGRVTNGVYSGIEGGAFYPPLLDDDGLHSFNNIDLTQNLLAYIPQPTTDASDAVTKTYTVINDYLIDPVYAETNSTYRTVATNTTPLHGHRVVQDAEGTGYTSPVDHFLVDKQDFNAPIAYTFASGKRMWYQRIPDNYVNLTQGWEGISIPFSPELVTTQDKGEITHFYQDNPSSTANNSTGHEYWLRQLSSLAAASSSTAPTADGGSPAVVLATFNPLAAGTEDKTYTNTFLYDYYYSRDTNLDHNEDDYQKQYYASTKTFEGYPLSEAATPYLIGFPGATYYEFDLSGTFVPANTYRDYGANGLVLGKQTITFASKPGETIAVSDDEIAAKTVTKSANIDTKSGYSFTPNYLSSDVAAGVFVLNNDGSSFAKTDAAQPAVPFRPYFVAASDGGGVKGARYITFNRTETSFDVDEEQPDFSDRADGELIVRGKRGHILVTSTLAELTTATIVNASGVLIRSFRLAPGETIDTPVATGVYIVNKKKISIK